MKKQFLAFALCVLLLCSAAYAHSGRTDGNGGHYDRSTGEYHYHHGYPAHQHYDMDGDGIIDCPYDFDVQTGRNSGSGQSGGKSSSATQSPEPEPAPTPTPTPTPTPQKSDGSTAKHIPVGEIVVAGILAPVAVLYAFIYIVDPIRALIGRIKEKRK